MYYLDPGIGAREVGGDLPAAVRSQDKTYRTTTAAGHVVFEVLYYGDVDLYLWDPATEASTAVGAGSYRESFTAVTPRDELVFGITAYTQDLVLYRHGPVPTWQTISGHYAEDVFEATLSNGDVVFRRAMTGGDELHLFSASTNAATPLVACSWASCAFERVLGRDRVVYASTGVLGGVFVADPKMPASALQVGPAGSRFAGETPDAGFVASVPAGTEHDLVLWSESGGVVPISQAAGDDRMGAALANGDVLFLRQDPGAATADVFLWQRTTGAERRLTQNGLHHTVEAAYFVDNRPE